MKILAIEKEIEGVDWDAVSKDLLKQEAVRIFKMYLAEQLREHYFNEYKCAILVLECNSMVQAQDLLGELPLVKSGLVTFEVMELHPYTGYERLTDIA